MAGIYIHIPFCRQACHYCNFHFSTSLRQKDALLDALRRELELRKDFLQAPIESIYFGGGTPSLLTNVELDQLFRSIHSLFSVQPSAEITLEANPDDLTKEKLKALKDSPVNRLSIGVQSFFEEDLRFMNRAHSAEEARRCIADARAMGFDNLTIDLIYGSPTTNMEMWQSNVETAIEMGIPHLSCYCLTVEPKTALAHFVKTGKVATPDEEAAASQFEYLMDRLEKAGYDHYEISNFAKPGMYSKHNTAYWLGEPYLGIGPSAHSFDGEQRYWNVANNARYIKAIQQGVLPLESESLSVAERYNEYVMTSLRTSWGCDLNKVRKMGPQFHDYILTNVYPFLENGLVIRTGDTLVLSKKGKLLADFIESELFWAD
jgi:oxygen-independent coproporphyrinogen-3 oxidase